MRINVVSASNIVVDAVAEWRAQHPAAKFQIVSSETASKIEPCDIEVRMQTGKTPEAKGARLFKERIMLAVPTTNGDETEECALRETKEPDEDEAEEDGQTGFDHERTPCAVLEDDDLAGKTRKSHNTDSPPACRREEFMGSDHGSAC